MQFKLGTDKKDDQLKNILLAPHSPHFSRASFAKSHYEWFKLPFGGVIAWETEPDDVVDESDSSGVLCGTIGGVSEGVVEKFDAIGD